MCVGGGGGGEERERRDREEGVKERHNIYIFTERERRDSQIMGIRSRACCFPVPDRGTSRDGETGKKKEAKNT